eukprot:CAMPEP_0179447112 /NCGR_PEP_ID=MMETSP0799-20121207/30869_1 /TAXON_ID=46947 /ORGANISM="Geminigera cryophila, Strain CCMP2564" /LENGTH=92 /DNA_ID=CAMNT_0021237451 /DNA_START=88 /DNA_END=366 /DNA_ORIENTATION=+
MGPGYLAAAKSEVNSPNRRRIMEMHKELLGDSSNNMTTMEKLPGDKGVTHYQGIGSMSGRMAENFKDTLPGSAKPTRPPEVRRYREEDEMWG